MTAFASAASPIDGAFSLEGKVAIVTGGGKGIGEAIARVFARSGAAVVAVARTATDVEEVAASIRAAGGRAIGFAADVTDPGVLPGVLERTVDEFDGVDVVVNNAGAGGSPAFADTRPDDLRRAFELMVVAPFELTRVALPHLRSRPGASVINLSSVGALRSTPGNLAHHTSKAALAHLTKLMAADLGPEVRVNALVPGAVETPGLAGVFGTRPGLRDEVQGRIRLGRLGTPEEIALAAVYLASPAAAWITGTLLEIHGGAVDEIAPVSHRRSE